MTLPSGEPVELVDLPGSYALDAASPDEEVTRKVRARRVPGEAQPEVLSWCSTPRPRAAPGVRAGADRARPAGGVALNMVDLAERDGLVLDPRALEEALGVRWFPTVAVRKRGLDALIAAIVPLRHAPSAIRRVIRAST
jgi:ferrous iron transport protein B